MPPITITTILPASRASCRSVALAKEEAKRRVTCFLNSFRLRKIETQQRR